MSRTAVLVVACLGSAKGKGGIEEVRRPLVAAAKPLRDDQLRVVERFTLDPKMMRGVHRRIRSY
ncbi:MAG TPA: hypothetical protein VKA59_13615 [Vicinamibacterales bacterium]|nr:hypothetical protein [Vicinamibacterales bacterium]